MLRDRAGDALDRFERRLEALLYREFFEVFLYLILLRLA